MVRFEGNGLHTNKHCMVLVEKSDNFKLYLNNILVTKKLYDLVKPQPLCTRLEYNDKTVLTVEHLFSVLSALKLYNISIKMFSDTNIFEMPILDGSAKHIYDKLYKLKYEFAKPLMAREFITTYNDSYIKYIPNVSTLDNLNIDITVEYENIGKLRYIYDDGLINSFELIYDAPTFCYKRDIEKMQSNGLALGGSEDNALIINDDGSFYNMKHLDKTALVKHKCLDQLGDFYLLGAPIKGSIISYKPSHYLNQLFVKDFIKNLDNELYW